MNVKLLDININDAEEGKLIAIEDKIFPIKRVFCILDVPDAKVRGSHSHYITEQILICLSGKIDITCDDGNEKKCYTLDNPNKGLWINRMIWDEQKYIEKGSILLVLANTFYDREDYIENYNEFLVCKKLINSINNCEEFLKLK